MTDPRPLPQGQIQTPNPLELLWEKHRRTLLVVVVIAAIAVGINYAIEYLTQKRVSELWSRVAVATNLDDGYTEDGSLAGLLQSQTGSFDAAGFYLQATHAELVSQLQSDLAAADPTALERAVAETAGTPAEPIVLWTAAVHHTQKSEWDRALKLLDDLEKRFPTHFLCFVTPYPPQYREPIEDKTKEEKETPNPRRREPPKLTEPAAGSAVSLLRAQIERERGFREAHSALYQAPEPAEKPEVVLTLSNDDQIRIRFYPDRAPEHVRNFLERARTDFYKDQRIDEVVRGGTQRGFMDEGAPSQLHFGLAVTAKEEDISKWQEARAKPSEIVLAFEDSGLSHFPGMVAAAAEADGKSSGERVWINASDAARFDGERVIFGRVVGDESLEALARICRAQFRDEDMNRLGRGQLQQDIQIRTVEIVE